MKDRTMRMLWAILLFLKEIDSLQFEEERKFDCSDQKLENQVSRVLSFFS